MSASNNDSVPLGSRLTCGGEDEGNTGKSHKRRARLSGSRLEGLLRKVESTPLKDKF
jgi:hypothetical protein